MSRSYATAFQAAELCLEQGFAKYGAHAIGNKLLRILTQRPRAWAPLSRPANTISGATLLSECRALPRNGTEPGRAPFLCPLTQLIGPLYLGNSALLRKHRCTASARELCSQKEKYLSLVRSVTVGKISSARETDLLADFHNQTVYKSNASPSCGKTTDAPGHRAFNRAGACVWIGITRCGERAAITRCKSPGAACPLVCKGAQRGVSAKKDASELPGRVR